MRSATSGQAAVTLHRRSAKVRLRPPLACRGCHSPSHSVAGHMRHPVVRYAVEAVSWTHSDGTDPMHGLLERGVIAGLRHVLLEQVKTFWVAPLGYRQQAVSFDGECQTFADDTQRADDFG